MIERIIAFRANFSFINFNNSSQFDIGQYFSFPIGVQGSSENTCKMVRSCILAEIHAIFASQIGGTP